MSEQQNMTLTKKLLKNNRPLGIIFLNRELIWIGLFVLCSILAFMLNVFKIANKNVMDFLMVLILLFVCSLFVTKEIQYKISTTVIKKTRDIETQTDESMV